MTQAKARQINLIIGGRKGGKTTKLIQIGAKEWARQETIKAMHPDPLSIVYRRTVLYYCHNSVPCDVLKQCMLSRFGVDFENVVEFHSGSSIAKKLCTQTISSSLANLKVYLDTLKVINDLPTYVLFDDITSHELDFVSELAKSFPTVTFTVAT